MIGAGPTGLTCAYSLVQKGFKTVIYEKENLPGGALTYVIPDFKLSKTWLRQEIEKIRAAGVGIVLNMEIGAEIDIRQLYEVYDALFIATGINCETSRRSVLFSAAGFLKTAAMDDLPLLKEERIAVIGKGEVAGDVIATAERLKAGEIHLFGGDKEYPRVHNRPQRPLKLSLRPSQPILHTPEEETFHRIIFTDRLPESREKFELNGPGVFRPGEIPRNILAAVTAGKTAADLIENYFGPRL